MRTDGPLLMFAASIWLWAVPAAAIELPMCPDPQDLASGKASFELHCRRCHTVEEATASFRQQDVDIAALRLRAFLGSHGGCPSSCDAEIVSYLRSVAGK